MKSVCIYRVIFYSGLTLLQISFVQTAAPHLRKQSKTEPCPRYKYVVRSENGAKRCKRCSECPKGYQVQTQCSAYNNTICEPCPTGWYNNQSGSRCKPCSGCMAGEYVRRTCIAKRDTKCHKCPRDTFSLSENATACVPCKRCRRNENIISKCSGNKDTDCGDCFHDHFRESSSGSCLPCSSCPRELRNRVVPECRNKLGIHHSNICWPGQNEFQLISKNVQNTDILKDFVEVEYEEYTYFRKMFTFVTAFLGSVLSCVAVIVLVFVVLRFQKNKSLRTCIRLDNRNDRNDRANINFEDTFGDSNRQSELNSTDDISSVFGNDYCRTDINMDSVVGDVRGVDGKHPSSNTDNFNAFQKQPPINLLDDMCDISQSSLNMSQLNVSTKTLN